MVSKEGGKGDEAVSGQGGDCRMVDSSWLVGWLVRCRREDRRGSRKARLRMVWSREGAS